MFQHFNHCTGGISGGGSGLNHGLGQPIMETHEYLVSTVKHFTYLFVHICTKSKLKLFMVKSLGETMTTNSLMA